MEINMSLKSATQLWKFCRYSISTGLLNLRHWDRECAMLKITGLRQRATSSKRHLQALGRGHLQPCILHPAVIRRPGNDLRRTFCRVLKSGGKTSKSANSEKRFKGPFLDLFITLSRMAFTVFRYEPPMSRKMPQNMYMSGKIAYFHDSRFPFQHSVPVMDNYWKIGYPDAKLSENFKYQLCLRPTGRNSGEKITFQPKISQGQRDFF